MSLFAVPAALSALSLVVIAATAARSRPGAATSIAAQNLRARRDSAD
jgi:hypothetical protein